MVIRREGIKCIKEFKGDEHCVAMAAFKENLYVATNKKVYIKKGAKFHALEMVAVFKK